MALVTLAKAVAAYQAGQWQQAAELCRQLLEGSAPEPNEARHLLGLSLIEMGDVDGAIRELQAALAARPQDRQVQRNLGLAWRKAGQPARAAEIWSQVPDPTPELRLQLAQAWLAADQDQKCEEQLLAILARDSGHVAAASQLAHLYDERNETERAAQYAAQALEGDPSDFQAALVRARLARRRGATAQALAQLRELAENPAHSPTNRALALGVIARIHDAADCPELAFANADAANQLLARTPAFQRVRGTSVYATTVIEQLDQWLDNARLEAWANSVEAPQPGARAPVFLVGFPRSGTTLADRMLAAHPEIAIVEERPTLHELLARIAGSDGAHHSFDTLDSAEAETLRTAYWQRVGDEVAGKAGDLPTVVVDKLPLNLVYVAPIWRVFPNARFIVALRDPRDVVLSCFLQTFAAVDAMSHFLALDTAAEYYRRVMTLGLRCLDGLPLPQYRLRYESLVENPEAEARAMLGFLGLNWDPRVARFREKLQGTRINTPSFDQVSQPIYDRAAGRWQRYRHQLEPILPGLHDLIARLGYSAEP